MVYGIVEAFHEFVDKYRFLGNSSALKKAFSPPEAAEGAGVTPWAVDALRRPLSLLAEFPGTRVTARSSPCEPRAMRTGKA